MPETRSKRKSSSNAGEAAPRVSKRSHLSEEANKGKGKLKVSGAPIPDPVQGSNQASDPLQAPLQGSAQLSARRKGRGRAAQTHLNNPAQQPSSAVAGAGPSEPQAASSLPELSCPPAVGEAPVAEPTLGANPEPMANRATGGNQEDDQDPGGHPFGRDFSSASSALQGLLRKLGAGFEDMLPGVMGMGSGQVKAIITGLRAFEDESQQLGSLTELCEFLSISTEDALASFPLETVVPLLVQLLNMEHNPDIMLLAARAMTFMADALPTSCGTIARHGAIPVFCARLLTIEYIDLAEQSLQALEKLSHEYSHVLLQHGGLLAVLSYLDFFPTGVQRVAAVTAANMCRGLTADHAEAVQAAVPILVSLLQYSDAKVVDNACIALSHIAEAFSSQPRLLAQLSSGGLITQALQLIAISDSGSMSSQLSLSTYFSLIKLITSCMRGSPAVAETLLQSGVLDTLRQLLASSSMLSSGGPATSSVVRSVDQLSDVICLICELLPAIPDAPSAVQKGLPLVGGASVEAESAAACERNKFLSENPQLLGRFSSQLLPLLLKVYTTTVMPQVRHTCLVAIAKVLCVSTPAMLEEALKDLSVSNFVAGLLGGRDCTAMAYAIQMAEILMEKLPDIYRGLFLKEGVLHAMEQLAATAPAEAGVAGDAAKQPAAGPSQQPEAAATDHGSRVTRSSSRLKEDKESRSKGKEKAKEVKDAKEDKEKDKKAAASQEELPKPAAAPTPKETLREALAKRVAQFKCAHYAGGSDAELETEGLALMRKLCKELPSADSARLAALLEALAGSSISVFELLNSGAVRELLQYLEGEDLRQPREGSSGATAAEQRALLERIQGFVEVALPPGSGSSPAMCTLVRKLQSALSSLDCFPVISARFGPSPASRLASLGGFAARFSTAPSAAGRGTAAGSLSSGLAMLTQPLKLRLARHASERQLRDYTANVVMIEPLASMSAIEDFLYPRVLRSASASAQEEAEGAAAASGRMTTGGTAAAADGKAAAAAAAKAAGGKDGSGSKKSGASKEDEGKPSGAAAAAGSAKSQPASSKAQPIPDACANRRVTRAQAALAKTASEVAVPEPVAVAAATAHRGRRGHRPGIRGGDDEDEEMQDANKPQEHEDAEDHPEFDPMHDSGEYDHGEDDEGRPIFDDDDDVGSYDEEMEEGGEEGDMDIQPAHVYDLLVEEPPAPGADQAVEAAGGSGSAAGRSAAGKAAGKAAASAKAAGGAAAGPSAEASAGRPAEGEQQAKPATAAAAVGQERPKLVFYIGDTRLSQATTVFQAVQQLYIAGTLAAASTASEPAEEQEEDANGQPQRRGRRLWDEIHTLHYRRASEVMAEDTAAEAVAAAAATGPSSSPSSSSDSAPASWSASPLGELLARPAELQALSSGEACREVLQLLQLLEVVNRQGPRIGPTMDPAATLAGSSGVDACSSKSNADRSQQVPGRVPREEFVNQKLGSKLGQQLKDVLSICGGSMPPWVSQLVVATKFLFPFEMRRRYFYCTAFGLGRALHHMQQLNAAETGGAANLASEGRELRVGRLQRQKVRVSRKRILESAVKVMELYAKQRTVLELEYFGEVGTGLGPTLEFFTLLSHDLQKKSLQLWRHEDNMQADAMQEDDAPAARPAAGERPAASIPRGSEVWHETSEYVNAPWGLFPSPLSEKQRAGGSKVVDHFRLLGRAMAKALQDSRLMDLPLSYVFYRAVLGKRVDLLDISRFDPQLGSTLERMRACLAAHRTAQASSPKAGPLLIDGARMSDLCLTFTLPGRPDYELRPGGADMEVTEANLGEYIDAVVDATLGSGIEAQLKAFREGFNEVFALSTLECFYEDELETLLCGSGEHWTVQGLADSIKFDHGYTGSSPVIKCFLEVLSELDVADQRRFLRFVTGCPRLPPGGIAALLPRLTVVRKHPTVEPSPPGTTPVGSFKDNTGVGTTAADCDLPSVMTCANYIKLPPYSSKEVMKQRLMYAINEGQGSFDLS